MRIAAAAVLYFAIVFAAGFLLGAIRVLWLVPRVGPTVAVLCESPFLLVAMMVAAQRVPRLVRLPQDAISLALTGVGALALQQLADFGVGIGLRGLSLSQQLAQFATAPGLIYGVLLVLFALMPLLLRRRRRCGALADGA